MAKLSKAPRQKPYSEADVNRCLREIRQGISVRKACLRNRVPRSTIKFRMGTKCKKQGRTGPPAALESADDKELVERIKKMARKGFPVTRYRLLNRVTSFIEKNPEKGCFKTGKPSKKIESIN